MNSFDFACRDSVLSIVEDIHRYFNRSAAGDKRDLWIFFLDSVADKGTNITNGLIIDNTF